MAYMIARVAKRSDPPTYTWLGRPGYGWVDHPNWAWRINSREAGQAIVNDWNSHPDADRAKIIHELVPAP